ncbi:unnamed protein product [Urochloa decumbens]|uniref:Uncharacterized protein n=1 Tax=Urochloa decumbens TaxID=240449 RepID=A0ABC9FGR0_9POAL
MLRLRNLLLPPLRGGPHIPSPTHHVGCRRLLSTSAAPFSLEDYLVASCSLAPDKARSTSKKALAEASRVSVRAFNELSSARHHPGFDPDAVLALLSGIGLSRADIADVVAADPLLLRSRVDRLEPRLLALGDRVGLSVPQIASFLVVGSRAVRKCHDVCPKILFFVNLFGSFRQAIILMKRCNGLLTTDLDRGIKPRIAFLHQCGISAGDIAQMCSRNPRVLTLKLDHLKEVVQRVEELGVPRSSRLFRCAVAVLASTTKEKDISRLELLKSTLCCSTSEVATAVAKRPDILELSDENLLRKIQFMINEVGLEPQYILERPELFKFSLEKRLVPRHRVIKVLLAKGLLKSDLSFCTIAKLGEQTFRLRFIDCHKDIVVGLADAYAAARGGSVPRGDQLSHL